MSCHAEPHVASHFAEYRLLERMSTYIHVYTYYIYIHTYHLIFLHIYAYLYTYTHMIHQHNIDLGHHGCSARRASASVPAPSPGTFFEKQGVAEKLRTMSTEARVYRVLLKGFGVDVGFFSDPLEEAKGSWGSK